MNKFTALIAIGLLITSTISQAEEINIPIGTQGSERKDAMPLPKRGQTLNDVIEQWGEPLSLGEPVGQPPIRKATYSGFSVVFESDRVIHAVLTHTGSKSM